MLVKLNFETRNNKPSLTVRKITSGTSELTITSDTVISGNLPVNDIDAIGSIGLKADKLYTHARTQTDIL